jgi:hypothetical protein
LAPSNEKRPVYQRALVQLLGKEKSDKINSETNLYGTPKKVPEELEASLVLSELNLHWDKPNLAFRSSGLIGVGFVNKVGLGRNIPGYFEIQRKRSGDALNLYLEINPSTWFYFNYQRGVMQAISSESKFNDIINNMKPEKRVADEKDGKQPYQYMVSTERKKSEFIKRMTKTDDE